MRVAKKHRGHLVAGAALTVVGALLTACGAADDAAGSEGVVRVATVVDVQSFDPGLNPGQGQRVFLDPVYDTLLTVGEDGGIEPGLASDWTLDKTELRMTIDSGRRFSDGTDLDAAAVVTALEHNQQAGGPAAAALANVKSVDVEGDSEVVLSLNAPSPALPLTLTDVAGMVASPAATSGGEIATTPVGTGPYVLDQKATKAGVVYVYTPNQEFEDTAVQSLKRIEIEVLTDAAARSNALISGQVDLAQVDRTQVATVEKSDLESAVSEGNHWLLHFVARDSGSALANEKIRQAVGYAINRQALVDTVLMGQATPMTQVFSEGSPFHVDGLESGYAFDPEKARQLVRESGVANPRFTIPTFGTFTSAAEAIQADLKDVGITVDIKLIQPGTLDQENRSKNFDAMLTPIKEIHPEQLYGVRVAENGPMNPYQVASPEISALHQQALDAEDEAEQDEIYRSMLTEISDEAIWQNLYTDHSTIAWNSTLSGVKPAPGWPMGPSLRGVTKD
ncbi:ABC transporter substrate-binding protein [Nocardioides alcanivorans]|uniref:ABC transporter substrate-binding protein n=1 Tax=Nocardioides alcanivorans TaxID=2897352 RepID=UPI001F29B50E|nr:ABC transporter substrate-binding protein [Nocardioides alcanivorans]